MVSRELMFCEKWKFPAYSSGNSMKLACAVEQPKETEAAMRGLTSDMRDAEELWWGRIMDMFKMETRPVNLG